MQVRNHYSQRWAWHFLQLLFPHKFWSRRIEIYSPWAKSNSVRSFSIDTAYKSCSCSEDILHQLKVKLCSKSGSSTALRIHYLCYSSHVMDICVALREWYAHMLWNRVEVSGPSCCCFQPFCCCCCCCWRVCCCLPENISEPVSSWISGDSPLSISILPQALLCLASCGFGGAKPKTYCWRGSALPTGPPPQLKAILWFQRNDSAEGHVWAHPEQFNHHKHTLQGKILFLSVPSFCVFSIMFLNYTLAFKWILAFLCIYSVTFHNLYFI